MSPIIETKGKSHPMDGTALLHKEYENVATHLRQTQTNNSIEPLRKTQWNFSVGSTKSWWAVSFTSMQYYQASSTCRAVNDHSYIFVEDSEWGTKVDQAAVDSISRTFEQSTSAAPSKGVYQMDVDAFGNPPDVDSDPRIIILVLDIPDGFNGNSAFIVGYFNPINETNLSYSNAAEIYYLDCNPTSLTTSSGITLGMGTTAHEFQHMINWNYHKINPELTFINEGLSQVATDICGYPLDFDSYMSDQNKFLFGWEETSDVINDYSRAARYFVYLKNQFGVGLFKKVVQNSSIGVDGLQRALSSYGVTETLDQIFINWCIANSVNDKNINPAYGYDDPNISKVEGFDVPFPIVSESNQFLYNHAVSYLNYTFGSNLKITFNSTSNIIIKAVERNNNSLNIVDVSLGQEFSEPQFGSTFSSIQFILIDPDLNNYTYYSYNSSAELSGNIELKWDAFEPSGYYPLSSNDTLCVVFNAFPGGILDSVRVALRRPGTITGGIWEFTGQISPTPLGAPLITPITASISTETLLPYPVPYDNWSSIDLRSYEMSTDAPFAVGFVIGTTPLAPAVMVSYYPGSEARGSFTYLQSADNNAIPGWYYFTSPAGDGVSVYLIRAYVHYQTTGISKEVELTPSDFTLAQNYPNPFNPSTTIRYSIPTNSHVTLKVFNLLGQEVTTDVDETLAAGKYTATFNASNLANGVYYYRIEAGSFKEVKKMVLIR